MSDADSLQKMTKKCAAVRKHVCFHCKLYRSKRTEIQSRGGGEVAGVGWGALSKETEVLRCKLQAVLTRQEAVTLTSAT